MEAILASLLALLFLLIGILMNLSDKRSNYRIKNIGRGITYIDRTEDELWGRKK